jgi:hypothetical protein
VFVGDQAVLTQHQVQGLFRRKRRRRRLIPGRADARETILRYHLQAAKSCRCPNRSGINVT